MTDARLIDIEIKLSRQEDLIDVLNDALYRQQQQISALEALCARLARQLQSGAGRPSDASAADEIPPHY